MILTSPSKLLTSEEDLPTVEADYDEECMAVLLRSRDVVLNYLEETSHTPGEALAVLLLYGHSIQEELDGGEGETFLPEMLLEEAKRYAGDGDLVSVLEVLSQLEILTPGWSTRLQNPAESPAWAPEIKKIAAYMVTRYWLQAVSDYDLVCRVKLVIVACLAVFALGGDLVETAQQFSKEIENNYDNIEALLDAAYTTNALTDLNLLRLLTK